MDDIWAYNTETDELVKIDPHPTPTLLHSNEEFVCEHLVKPFPFVIYFFVDNDLLDLLPMEVSNG